MQSGFSEGMSQFVACPVPWLFAGILSFPTVSETYITRRSTHSISSSVCTLAGVQYSSANYQGDAELRQGSCSHLTKLIVDLLLAGLD